jgi:hypothetical protein
VRFCHGSAENVQHPEASDEERISDERPMAAPRNRFRAQDGCGFAFGEISQPPQAGRKFRRLHVIGKAPEGGVAPAEIHGTLPRVPAAAKPLQVHIAQSRGTQAGSKDFAVELGRVPGAWNAADVNQALDAMRFQQMNEIREGSRGMAHGENDSFACGMGRSRSGRAPDVLFGAALRRFDSIRHGFYNFSLIEGRGSSLVERRPEKAGVASSILAPGTTRSRHRFLPKEIHSAARDVRWLPFPHGGLKRELPEMFCKNCACLIDTIGMRD